MFMGSDIKEAELSMAYSMLGKNYKCIKDFSQNV